MGRVPHNEHFIHWKYHQKYDGSEETTYMPQLRHNVAEKKSYMEVQIKTVTTRVHTKFGVLISNGVVRVPSTEEYIWRHHVLPQFYGKMCVCKQKFPNVSREKII